MQQVKPNVTCNDEYWISVKVLMFFNLGLHSKNSTHAGQPTAMKQKKRKIEKKHKDQMQYSSNCHRVVARLSQTVGSISDVFFTSNLPLVFNWLILKAQKLVFKKKN